MDPALQEQTQASPDDGSQVVLESDESRQGEKTAESSRKSGDYKLFCVTHKNLTYVFLTFPLALATREDRARETAFTPPSLSCTATLQLAAADFTSPFSQPEVTQSNPASPASTSGLPHPPLALKPIILMIDYLM